MANSRSVLRHHHGVHKKDRRILTSFTTITPADEDDGDYGEEHGWVDKSGARIACDSYDLSNGITVAVKAAKWLLDHGALEASSSHFHKGVWYTQSDGSTNYRTGENTQESYHLKGFSEAEEKEIFRLVKARG